MSSAPAHVVQLRGFKKFAIEPKLAYRLINHGPLVLITVMDPVSKKPNMMPAAWHTPISTSPPLIGVVLDEGHYTTGIIRRTSQFTLNIPNTKLVCEIEKAGNVSGARVDKFVETGLTPMKGIKVESPFIDECIAFIECRLRYDYDIEGSILMVGEVLYAAANDGLFDGKWNLSKEMARTVHHLGAENFAYPLELEKR